jgi:hypothetical protein
MSRKGTEKPDKPVTGADVRRQRLAEALRSNLKRRKAAKTLPPDVAGKPDSSGD